MIKKYVNLLIIFFVSLGTFCSPFTYVEAGNNATSQPETCYGPSKMMSYYFDFQNEAIKTLLGSELNSLRFSTAFGTGGLFSNKILGLSAIDMVATNVATSTASFISNATTSLVLLSLASASVIQSNIEGLAILFKDRPIVRDYKKMLDIETKLFNVAYFRSKQINLTLPIKSESLFKDLKALIEEYQGKGLLAKGTNMNDSTTMADIIYDLIAMNAAMKHFIMIGGNLGEAGLRNYNGCFGNIPIEECNTNTSILKFEEKAIQELGGDYKEVRAFGKCNSYASFFKSSVNKAINNNKDSVKTAVKDIKEAMKRLKGALLGSYDGKTRNNRCDMTDYEMAQLQAYWGGNWKCEESLIKKNISISNPFSEIKDYFNKKKAQKKQEEKVETFVKKSEKPKSKDAIIGDVAKKLKNQENSRDKGILRSKIFGKDNQYNTDFSFEMNSNFIENFGIIIDQYGQAQQNAIGSDISDLFIRGKGILYQVDTTITNTDNLETVLQKIEDKQCTG